VIGASAFGGYVVGATVGHLVEDATGSKALGTAAGTLAGALLQAQARRLEPADAETLDGGNGARAWMAA
jgi:hypothetical protein